MENLSLERQIKVDAGNRAAKASLHIFRLCVRFAIPVMLENPRSSFLWKLPEMKPIAAKHAIAHFHQYAFGAKWRKHTTLPISRSSEQLRV